MTITLYALDALGQWTGDTRLIDASEGWGDGWIYADHAPAAPGPDQAAVWAAEAWHLLERRPAPAPAPERPMRITKIEFSRLFTDAQLVGYLALEAQAKALTPADFADPAKSGVIQAAVMFKKFDMLPDLIELDHPETIAGVDQVLVAAGVLTADEAARILANVPPAE